MLFESRVSYTGAMILGRSDYCKTFSCGFIHRNMLGGNMTAYEAHRMNTWTSTWGPLR